MKQFTTIFEKSENIHLIKDVGQIPYLMHKQFDYDAKLVTYKNDAEYSYLEDEVKGLSLEFIPKVKLGRYSLSILWYLFFNAKRIDVLHLFHHREKTYLNFLMYKWRNPQGKAFLKSDMGLNSIKEQEGFIPKKRPKYAVRNWLFHKALPHLDVVTIESQGGYEIVKEKYGKYTDKFLFMSNGINIDSMYASATPKKYEEKEDIILTVGRIGADEKNNEMLLTSLKELDLQNYKVYFVGPIEEDFHQKIAQFYKEAPHLKSQVIFTGAIYERKKLFELYAKSKIFCLTSKAESFGFVLIEAMAYGNYVITTDVSSAKEITENEKYGKIVKDEADLVQALKSQINENRVDTESIQKYVYQKYNWKTLLSTLDRALLDS